MNVENVDMFAGEDRTLTFHGRNASNVPFVLSDSFVSFYVGRAPLCPYDPTPLISKAGTITGATSGTFTVALLAADTRDMLGDYELMAKAIGNNTGAISVILRGRFRVNPVLAREF